MDYLEKIGSNIKRIRKYLGLKQENVAYNLKISQSEYSKYENGKIDFPISILEKLSLYFQVPIDSFITGDKPPCIYVAEFAKTIHPDAEIRTDKIRSTKAKEFNDYMLRPDNLEKTKILESAVILAQTDYVKKQDDKITLIKKIKKHVADEKKESDRIFNEKLEEYWEYLLSDN